MIESAHSFCLPTGCYAGQIVILAIMPIDFSQEMVDTSHR